MSGPKRTLWQKIRSMLIGQTHESEPGASGVVLHDPAGQGPHDLDDPYFDPKVQERFADVIANSMKDKR